MSRTLSPPSKKPYGVARVAAVWEIARSTFYAMKIRQWQPDRPFAKRGPKTPYTDLELTGQIRRVIEETPFFGEGHRKIWARLRFQGIRTSRQRVLRLMRQAGLLAPSRQPEAAPRNPHQGTMISERPDQMWGTDATATVTTQDGQVTIFAAIDHCSADCVGIHAVKRATRFEALEPIRQGVREHFGGFSRAVAAGLALRHDHGSKYMSDDFQKEIRFLGIASSLAFVRQPEGNGCIERFFRTLKDQLLWVRHFNNLEELRQALAEFRETYNRQWLIQRLGFKPPRQVREERLAL
jgi:transposase InsO family protein